LRQGYSTHIYGYYSRGLVEKLKNYKPKMCRHQGLFMLGNMDDILYDVSLYLTLLPAARDNKASSTRTKGR